MNPILLSIENPNEISRAMNLVAALKDSDSGLKVLNCDLPVEEDSPQRTFFEYKGSAIISLTTSPT